MEKRTDNRAWLFVAPALTMLLLSAAFPLVTTVNYSVQDVFSGDQFFWVGPYWFERVMTSPEFYSALLKSLAFALAVLAVEIPLGILIALKMPPKGLRASIYIVLISIPLLTPWLVVGFLWKMTVNGQVGLIGSALAGFGIDWDLNNAIVAWITIVLMDAWHWTSLVALLCYAGLVSIPRAHYQAASIDGASRWDVFRYVELPRLRRVLLIAILLRFIDSFMIYVEPFMVTRGGPGTSTTFLSLDLVQTASIQFDLGEASAMSIVYFLVILLFSWSLYKIMMQRDA